MAGSFSPDSQGKRTQSKPGSADRRSAVGLRECLFVRTMGVKPAYALGLFDGSGISAPMLQAPMEVLGNEDAAIGYSIAYPFDVARSILFLYFLSSWEHVRGRNISHRKSEK